ncbi:phosphopantetheine-binding protein [Planomonospora algeriensis]
MSDTAVRLRAEIAELLYVDPEELEFDENLMDAGLDSIRVMTLIERWRREGVELTFADLAEKPTVAAWAELLS